MFYSPLRYPGGKGKLASWVEGFMRHNGLTGGAYFEPYAGGAGVALHLLLREYVDHIYINDADPVIYSFWWAVINESEALVDLIERTPVTLSEREVQRDIIKNHENHDTLTVGFAAFFLNRTNRSGIIKGGVIGGKKQTGKDLIDARFNKENLIERILTIARYKNRITISCKDALELLWNNPIECLPKSLTYLDPPYFNKGSQLYRNFYNPSDHQAVRDAMMSFETPWIITYDNCEPINKLYSAFNKHDFSITYSASTSRHKGAEVLILPDYLDLHCSPDIKKVA